MSTFEIRSPLPGTFYRTPAPDAAPFKADGDAVASADTIGMIEVMKTFQGNPGRCRWQGYPLPGR